jgi:hypothetical protein
MQGFDQRRIGFDHRQPYFAGGSAPQARAIRPFRQFFWRPGAILLRIRGETSGIVNESVPTCLDLGILG